MKIFLVTIFTFFSMYAIAQDALKMTTPMNAQKAFEAFITKEKFMPCTNPKYIGIKKDKLRWTLTEKVDLIGKGFKKVAALEQPTDVKYNIEIMNGLSSFNKIKAEMTKGDRIRVCQYITELMDIIELPSSKGQLNMFAYGFDPSTLKAKEK